MATIIITKLQLYIDVDVQIKVFPSWIAFTAWKEEEEQGTYSFFVQPKGAVESTITNDVSKYD